MIELAGRPRLLLEAMQPAGSAANFSEMNLIATSRPSRGSRAR